MIQCVFQRSVTEGQVVCVPERREPCHTAGSPWLPWRRYICQPDRTTEGTWRIPAGNQYEPHHEKTCLMPYANNKDAHQPAHPCSLISSFVFHCLDYTYSCYIQNSKTLAGFCSGAGHLICLMTKPTKWPVRQVWSVSSLSAWRKLGALATHWAHSEDCSDWADALADQISFAGRTVILLVWSWGC